MHTTSQERMIEIIGNSLSKIMPSYTRLSRKGEKNPDERLTLDDGELYIGKIGRAHV